jgi:hypothetical protein
LNCILWLRYTHATHLGAVTAALPPSYEANFFYGPTLQGKAPRTTMNNRGSSSSSGVNNNRGSSSNNSNESPPLGIVGQSFFSPFAPKVAPKRGGGASQKTKVEVERREAAPWNSRAKAAAPKIVKAAGPKIVKGAAGLKAVKAAAPNRGFTAEQQHYIDRMQFQLDPGDEW